MTFLYPIAWIFAGLLPVVVVLYLRRIRRREVTVPALLFWQRAVGEQRHRTFLGSLRQWWSLLLQLLIILLLLLALLRPEPKGVSAAGESTVILLDTRARMQALEADGQSRFAKARAQARPFAAAAREGAGVALLGIGPEGMTVLAPFSHEPQPLLERLDAIAPGDTSGNLAAAVAQARELLAARPGAQRLIVLTDGRDLPGLPEGGEAIPLERVAVGTTRPNVAITRFAARSQLSNPQAADLFLSLANFSDQPAVGSVEISCNDQLLDVKPFRLEPGERKTDTFHAIPRLGDADGRFHARLTLTEGTDALALDNEARAIMPAIRPLRVLLVSKGNWFLEKLFAADPALRFDFLTPDSFTPSMAASFDVVVYDQCGPGALEEVQGNALFIRSNPFAPAEEIAVVNQPVIAGLDADHPMMRMVEWGNVTLLRAARLALPEVEGWSFTAPLRDAEVPLIVAGNRGRDQRVALFGFDIAETDLPLRIAFPLLMANTLHWLSGEQSGSTADALCGDLLALAPGESVRAESEPTDRPAPPSSEAIAGSFQPTRVGFYEIRGEENARWIAVNADSLAESDLTIAEANPAGTLPAARLAFAAGLSLWQWLALAALILLAVEWSLYHRRYTE